MVMAKGSSPFDFVEAINGDGHKGSSPIDFVAYSYNCIRDFIIVVWFDEL